MKKTFKMMAALLALSGLLTACSMNDDADQAKNDVENQSDEMKDDVEDSIDNVMTYFKDQGVMLEQDTKIDKMDFAAYEGRTFGYNGSTAYLYRVKSKDEGMQKVMKQAKDSGKVKVSIDNKEQEYAAKVNGNYLLLYDMNADMGDVVTAFPKYTMPTQTPPVDNNQTSTAKDATDNSKKDNKDGTTNNSTTDGTTNPNMTTPNEAE